LVTKINRAENGSCSGKGSGNAACKGRRRVENNTTSLSFGGWVADFEKEKDKEMLGEHVKKKEDNRKITPVSACKNVGGGGGKNGERGGWRKNKSTCAPE